MHVFVTGATGFVGTAVVKDLLDAGHTVTGLVRSDAGAASLAATGAAIRRGELTDLAGLRAGAAEAEAVIHTAFIHDFSKFKENCEIDRRAIVAMGDALVGSGKPLIVTSGTALLTPGRVVTEDVEPPPPSDAVPRVSEQAALPFASRGVRAMAVRLPPTVHGEGDHGFVPLLIELARQKGVSAYVDEGHNHWPAVHRLDAARVYRLALEKRTAGTCYHAVAEEGVPFRAIAEAIGRGLYVPVESRTRDDAAAHFGWFAHFAAIDNRPSSRRTRDALGWDPRERGLLADLEGPGYFEPPRRAA